MNSYFSIENAPSINARVAFSENSSQIFREDGDITPLQLDDTHAIMPWGGDNQLPYNIMDKIDSDETTATCMNFMQEVCFAAGLEYVTAEGRNSPGDLRDFLDNNNIDNVYLGQCADLKMFDFSVCVLLLDKDNKKIVRIIRKHAAYCRLAVADEHGNIPFIAYANWRLAHRPNDIEYIPLLNPDAPLADLRERVRTSPGCHKYAILTKVAKASSTYYPIPAYASIFKGDWYDIKQLIGKAKKAKLKNSAPIKYHIQVAAGYWERQLEARKIVDPVKAQACVKELKKQMIDFLTGMENSGKCLFSENLRTPDGKELPEVTVTKISSDEKEGGDYTTDIQEAVNMICFAMRVHSNLVGSVPGKSQSNNSGSDKRELYTIAQALQRPYHRILFQPHKLICAFNGWKHTAPECRIIQLQTLDKHNDAQANNI